MPAQTPSRTSIQSHAPTPQTTPLAADVDSRKRLRDVADNPKKRRKGKPKAREALEFLSGWQVHLDVIDRKTRWMYFLHFRNDKKEDLVREVLGLDVNPDSFEFGQARGKVMDLCKHFKQKLLTNAEEHVTTILRIDDDDHAGLIRAMTESKTLARIFGGKFCKESFFEVFWFMTGYLEFDSSKPLGKYYCKHLYANLCSRVKLHLDWKSAAASGSAGTANNRTELLGFVDVMALSAMFDGVNKNQFVELTNRTARQKRAPKRKTCLLPDEDEHFHIDEQPPAAEP
ncbi:MAG: hypothetical protein M4579_007310 [Chaenotheca gracillima]|nr:MAG: hypothetical protein M4579_007310 [Chaenotheca gracillima]